jgi:RimJ/RimL family protein N-acetyltransferase
LRKATVEDGAFLLAVRNADDVRSQSKHTELISEETHRRWLERHLYDSASAIWVIEQKGDKLGYIRAQRLEEDLSEAGKWLLSIALNPHSRAQGYGAWAVKRACRLLHENFHAKAVIAEVLNSNSAALRLFKTSGFRVNPVVQEPGNGFMRLELSFGQ